MTPEKVSLPFSISFGDGILFELGRLFGKKRIICKVHKNKGVEKSNKQRKKVIPKVIHSQNVKKREKIELYTKLSTLSTKWR